MLADGIIDLDPAPALFEAMLTGWATQQRARFLKSRSTIEPRMDLIRRLSRFSNQYPWEWEPAEVEAFMASLSVAASTARNYQNSIRLFCEFASDDRYGWPARCLEAFGSAPRQIMHEWNSIVHTAEYEGVPGRRPLTYDEVQALFDAADSRVEEIRSRRRKGALAALRDAAMLKTVYAFGLRRQETTGLDVTDWRRNPKVPAYGRFGGVFVRWASRLGRPAQASHRVHRRRIRLGCAGAGALPGRDPAPAYPNPASGDVGDRARRRVSRRLLNRLSRLSAIWPGCRRSSTSTLCGTAS